MIYISPFLIPVTVPCILYSLGAEQLLRPIPVSKTPSWMYFIRFMLYLLYLIIFWIKTEKEGVLLLSPLWYLLV